MFSKNKSERTGSRKGSGVRRCVRFGLGAAAAQVRRGCGAVSAVKVPIED